MLFTYFVLGFAFAMPEMIIVYNWPWLKRFVESNPIKELLFSLGLSVVLAAAMGVGAGVTLAVANVFSTFITLAAYHLHVVENFKAFVAACRIAKKNITTTLSEFAALIHFMLRIVTFPFRAIAAVLSFLNRGAARIEAITARSHS